MLGCVQDTESRGGWEICCFLWEVGEVQKNFLPHSSRKFGKRELTRRHLPFVVFELISLFTWFGKGGEYKGKKYLAFFVGLAIFYFLVLFWVVT